MTQWQLPFDRSTTPADGEFGNWAQWRKNMGLGRHRGHDFAPGRGKSIPALADGVVVNTQYDTTGKRTVLGNVIEVRADDGMFYGFAHMAEQPAYKVGQRVRRGDILGHVGSTGTATTGPHLHMTLSDHEDGIFAGTSIDPIAYILARVSAPVTPPPVTGNGDVWNTYQNGWLGRGTQGPKVARMQVALKKGYPAYAKNIATDGDFGPFTESVVKEFQRRSGLTPDGLAGPKMFAKLGLAW